MKVVVTGGAGLIGSHLCAALLAEGHQVVCVDSFLTGSKTNISGLTTQTGFSLLEADVVDPAWTRGIEADFIYHMASPASPLDYAKYPLETLMVNSVGSKNVLDLATASGAGVLIASTSEVYGDPLETPQKETYWGNVNSIGTRSCYDEAKRFSEALAMSYWRSKSTRVRIARIFNTFGPHMRGRDGRVVPNFILQALSSEPLTVYGDGSQTRSFCYVSDLVAALMVFPQRPQTIGEVINIGNPHEMTVMELAKVIIELTGSNSKIVYEPLPEDDPTQRHPDITKAGDLLGWKPEVGLREGLEKTIQWFKELLVA